MADIDRSTQDAVKKQEEDGRIQVVQGNVDIIQLKFLESINNNLTAIKLMIEEFVKPKQPTNG